MKKLDETHLELHDIDTGEVSLVLRNNDGFQPGAFPLTLEILYGRGAAADLARGEAIRLRNALNKFLGD